jgi:hypothetical protein
MHAAYQSGQAEKMVAVQVRQADMAYALHLLMIDPQLGLGVLAAVQQQAETVHIHHLPAAMARHRGQRCPRA